jgi:hypothetical protein
MVLGSLTVKFASLFLFRQKKNTSFFVLLSTFCIFAKESKSITI